MMKAEESLISIIMPVYNAERYLAEALRSVISQTYNNWELLVINDGSADGSKSIINGYGDERIRYFEQRNRGVSAARNIGLQHMQGSFFCFLDADDILPPDSLKVRMLKFTANKSLSFVDGSVVFFGDITKAVIRKYTPGFVGVPLRELFLLNGKCFACPSWMIKRDLAKSYRMKEGLTHGEDLLFYMELSRAGGLYDFVKEEILLYRQHSESAMRKVVLLEKSYWRIFNHIKAWPEFSLHYRIVYKLKVKKFMLLEYLKRGKMKEALFVLLK